MINIRPITPDICKNETDNVIAFEIYKYEYVNDGIFVPFFKIINYDKNINDIDTRMQLSNEEINNCEQMIKYISYL